MSQVARCPRYGRHRHAGRPAIVPRPHAVPGAQWQAGVTDRNDEYRVLLDGVPVPLAFAASSAGGWVLAFEEPRAVKETESAGERHLAYRIPRGFGHLNPIGSTAEFRRLTGVVRIVRDC